MGVRSRIEKAAAAPSTTTPFRRPSGRASYPRRITLDLDDRRYQWLRTVSYEARVPAAAILRAALDVLSAPELLEQVVQQAQAEHPPP